MLWAILPLVPVLSAFALLEWIYGPAFDFSDHKLDYGFPAGPLAEMAFFNSFIIYVAVACFHVAVCAAVIGVIVLRIRTFDGQVQRWMWSIAVFLVVVLTVSSLIMRGLEDPGALNLTYRNTCEVLQASSLATHLMPEACSSESIGTMAWLAILPYGFGLLAAVFGAAVASVAGAPQPDLGTETGRAELRHRARVVDQAFKAEAFILVTSTIALMLYYQLPIELVGNPDVASLLQAYGQGMGMFWGMIFTLTLLATFGPAAILLRRQFNAAPATAENQSGDEPLEAMTAASTRKQLTAILSVLAPLLVGSAGSVMEMLFNAL